MGADSSLGFALKIKKTLIWTSHRWRELIWGGLAERLPHTVNSSTQDEETCGHEVSPPVAERTYCRGDFFRTEAVQHGFVMVNKSHEEKQRSQSVPQILSDFSIAFILKPICSYSPWKSFPERKQVTHVGFLFLFCVQQTQLVLTGGVCGFKRVLVTSVAGWCIRNWLFFHSAFKLLVGKRKCILIFYKERLAT